MTSQKQKIEKINNFKDLKLFLIEIGKEIEPIIREILILNVDNKNKNLIKYQITTGGKRIRPALAIISYKLLGGKGNNIFYPAAGLEILHNYTLIVDDIIDHSQSRRNNPTVWYKFGKSIAQCISISYGASIFQAANKLNDKKKAIQISEIFSRTMKIVIDGEILDILFEQRGREKERFITKNRYKKITEKDYLKMISQKTASLFEACCETGAVYGEANPKQLKALKNFGYNLGITFQISDDILDIFGERKKTGKKVGSDIRERKLGNILIFYALQEPKYRDKLLKILKKRRITEKDIREAIKIIKSTKAKEKAFKLGIKYVKRAKTNLEDLPKNQYRDIFEKLTDFVILREK